MKNAIFKLFKVTFPFALAFMMCLPFSMILNAASVKNIPVMKIFSVDITGDGKADKILITTSMDKDCFLKKTKPWFSAGQGKAEGYALLLMERNRTFSPASKSASCLLSV